MPSIPEPLNLIDELAAAKPRIAFFTTFTLDHAFFETELFEALQSADRGCVACCGLLKKKIESSCLSRAVLSR